MKKKIKVGIIGFGLSGKFFHTPLLQAHGGYQIDMVCSSDTGKVKSSLPEVRVTPDPCELIDHPHLDLIINAAPNSFHFSYSEAALKNGKNVVIEKPFVNSVNEGKHLIELAQRSGKVLSIFHNRRWDSDFLTVKKLIKEGKLGHIKHFESHFDRWRPTVRPDRWREQSLKGSGILYDLGTHLIDQALNIFGSPDHLTADICNQKEGSVNDDFFHIILKYGSTRVLLQSSSFSSSTPRFQIFGDQACFTKFGLDPQEEQMKHGVSVLNSSFGIEEEKYDGQLVFPNNQKIEKIKSEKGSYLCFYDLLYKKITTGLGELPVSPQEALSVAKIIELAFQSSTEGRTIRLPIEDRLGTELSVDL